MKKIAYDLTEVMKSSSGRLQYYGILRVVAETARELKKLDHEIEFYFYLDAYDAFVKVEPIFGDFGSIEFEGIKRLKQLRLRRKFGTFNVVKNALLSPIRWVIDAQNRAKWRSINPNEFQSLDLENRIFISCGRPKLMVDQIVSLQKKGIIFDYRPLMHDMIPLHPEFSHKSKSFKGNFFHDNKFIMAHCAHLISNSDFTKNDLEKFIAKGILPKVKSITAVPLVHECPIGYEKVENFPPIDPYFLCVGASIGRKNLEIVFDALTLMAKVGNNIPKLVLAGDPRKSTAEYLANKKYDDIRESVIIRKNPNQNELIELYKNSLGLVIASRMEGWGLPAGEALWIGTPAVCSNIPALREVCGDLGLYFDPDAPQELAEILAKLTFDEEFRSEKVAQIKAQKESLRTWSDVARDFRSALDQQRL